MVRMTPKGVALRAVCVMIFCLASYNGSGYHLFAYVLENWSVSPWPVLLVGAMWAAATFFLAIVMKDTMGWVGIGFVIVILGLAIGWAWSAGLLDLTQVSLWQWGLPILTGIGLSLGLVGSYFYRRATGRLMVEGEG